MLSLAARRRAAEQGDLMGDKSPKQQNRNAQQKKTEKTAKGDARKARTPQQTTSVQGKAAAKK